MGQDHTCKQCGAQVKVREEGSFFTGTCEFCGTTGTYGKVGAGVRVERIIREVAPHAATAAKTFAWAWVLGPILFLLVAGGIFYIVSKGFSGKADSLFSGACSHCEKGQADCSFCENGRSDCGFCANGCRSCGNKGWETCRMCNGKGTRTCFFCKGTGKTK